MIRQNSMVLNRILWFALLVLGLRPHHTVAQENSVAQENTVAQGNSVAQENTVAQGNSTIDRASAVQENSAEKIDFATQIKPLFEAHCYRCHGPMQRLGGLRLDRRDEVMVGGYSQKPLVGGTLETNEIYRRVASHNPAYRMPKGEDALPQGEMTLIKRWVEQGAIWPDDETKIKATVDDSPDWWDEEAWLDYVDRWLKEVPGFFPWLFVMLGLMVLLLFVERYKSAVLQNRPWTNHAYARLFRALRGFGVVHFLLIVALMGWVLTLLVFYGQMLKLSRVKMDLRDAMAQNRPSSAGPSSVYGNPPIPHHPKHPPRLRGEYYRGNCERNPKLYNGGNYRTATLRVSLIDSNGRDVQYGDRIELKSLAIRFELDRAQGTTPDLYTEGTVLKGVFLTPQLLSESPSKLEGAPIRLTEIKPGWKWAATFPLDGPPKPSTTAMSGLIYVYQGGIEKNKGRGTLHYGIKYDLRFQDSILLPTSEVWLGSLFWTATLEHPIQGKVPLKEWFNDEPIPEIVGENTKDPVLLGIPEHRKQDK